MTLFSSYEQIKLHCRSHNTVQNLLGNYEANLLPKIAIVTGRRKNKAFHLKSILKEISIFGILLHIPTVVSISEYGISNKRAVTKNYTSTSGEHEEEILNLLINKDNYYYYLIILIYFTISPEKVITFFFFF